MADGEETVVRRQPGIDLLPAQLFRHDLQKRSRRRRRRLIDPGDDRLSGPAWEGPRGERYIEESKARRGCRAALSQEFSTPHISCLHSCLLQQNQKSEQEGRERTYLSAIASR